MSEQLPRKKPDPNNNKINQFFQGKASKKRRLWLHTRNDCPVKYPL